MCQDIYKNGILLFSKNTVVNERVLEILNINGFTEIEIRSVIKCLSSIGACATCYGIDQTTGRLVAVGSAVGTQAAQSIGEPTTQLVLRTFHSGGAAQGISNISSIESIEDGHIKYDNLVFAVNSSKEIVVMSRDAVISLFDNNNELLLKSRLQYGSRIYFKDGEKVNRGVKLADWNPYNNLIIADKSGKLRFSDIIDGKSLHESYDEETGVNTRSIYEFSSLKPQIKIMENDIEVSTVYLQPKNILLVENNTQISRGDTLAMETKGYIKTKDMTGGLAGVEAIFENKIPSQSAVLAHDTGVIKFAKNYKNKKLLLLETEEGKVFEYNIPKHKSVVVQHGEKVKKGDFICHGQFVFQDLLEARGIDALVQYMIQEISMIYHQQGVYIYSKHFEVIIRKMLSYVIITDAGDSYFFKNDTVSKSEVAKINNSLMEQGKKPVSYKYCIQGITKASLNTDSFLSAASFQETTRIFVEAAISGKKDYLQGIQERVITGHMIPCGTGAKVSISIEEEVRAER